MKWLTDVKIGLVWLGKEVKKVVEWVPKVVKLTDDIEQDAQTLFPQALLVFEDVEDLALAAVKDGGHVVSAAQVLGLAIAEAVEAKMLNIADDEAVVAAFKGFVQNAIQHGNWLDVLNALAKLTQDYDQFGATAKAAIAKLEADATGG